MLLFAVWLLLLTLAEAHTKLLQQLLLLCHLSPQGTWEQVPGTCTEGWGGSFLHPSSDWGDGGQGNRDQEAVFSLGDVLGEGFALVFF